MQRRPERISSLNVERGLYVLRYVGGSVVDHPVIFVRPSPGSDHLVTFIPVPGEPSGRLDAPGAYAVIVVSEAAMLQVTAQAASPNGSLVAEVRVEPLALAAAQAGQSVAAPASARPVAEISADPLPPVATPRPAVVMMAPSPLASAEDVSILAHVSRRGDVAVQSGEWVGGPDTPAPIEGLAIECSSSIGALQYQVLSAGENRWSEWLSNGAFGGSRGRAKPLTGVRVRLNPAAETDVLLNGEALFLGSALIRKDGTELEFRSVAGLDPLVGFRLATSRAIQAPAPKPGIISTTPQHGRVRVFKASGRRSG